jgi:hypothetical protein
VYVRNIYAGTAIQRPYTVAGKQQRDPVTGALLYITLPAIAVEFDSFCNYNWGWGNGVLNASSNLLNNCWGALSSKDAWLGKKYHISGCTAEVGQQKDDVQLGLAHGCHQVFPTALLAAPSLLIGRYWHQVACNW